MEINRLTINHMENPIGFSFDELFINCYIDDATGIGKLKKKITIFSDSNKFYSSDWENADDLFFDLKLNLEPKTLYKVVFELKSSDQNQNLYASKESFFETGLVHGFNSGKWIGTRNPNVGGILLNKEFEVKGKVKKARAYVSGLGLYEIYIDGNKLGDEFLTPGFSNYNYYTQIATYKIDPLLVEPGKHNITISLGDGWYKGKIGIKEHGGKENQYGDSLKAIAEIHLNKGNEENQIIYTDRSWEILSSPIIHSGIYYGEDIDKTRPIKKYKTEFFKTPSKHLLDRLSLPIKLHEKFNVKKIIETIDGTKILDFGQNIAGWIIFKNNLPKGQKITIEYGEMIQNGKLYRKNLRSARAAFTYVSDGIDNEIVRPHFTYFGFRYAEIKGYTDGIDFKDFTAYALYSDMHEIGSIETSNSKVNKLFENIKWGQKSNFIDIPTDCPQRDERLGWTGDAAIFSKTASYNMDAFEFNRKYSFDIAVEQSFLKGKVPLYVPSLDEKDGGKALWSDAATIIPWVAYIRSRDPYILKQNFGAMMSWVDWVHDYAKKTENEFLWLNSDQLGDWLALDTEDIMHLKGRTPDDLIASAYYFVSSSIVYKSAKILKRKHDYELYKLLSEKIKEAFISEFFTKSGRLISDTQTSFAICLSYGLYPEKFKEKIIIDFKERLEKDKNHLRTGFVGTPLLLPALSENENHPLAVQIFLNEDYPSWLYEVNHGATTIWERWNSIDENGKIADNGMNSLNHYSAGSVMEWAYRYLVGIRDDHDLTIYPGISEKFKKVYGYTEFPNGKLEVEWEILDKFGKNIRVFLNIPYGYKVKVFLPRSDSWLADGQKHTNNDELPQGKYEIIYHPNKPFLNSFTTSSPISNYINDVELSDKLSKIIPFWNFIKDPANLKHFKDYSLIQLSREMRGIGFSPLKRDQIIKIDKIFEKNSLKKLEDN